MNERFRNRQQAGQVLAQKLARYGHRPDVNVFGLPRGGVPVAFEVARSLHAPLDVCLVRKLGVPGQEELAMGAIAAGGHRALNWEIIQIAGIAKTELDSVLRKEERELARRGQLYRGNRPRLVVEDRIAIVVDDGLATGSTMHVAVIALREQYARRIVVAAPVGARSTCEELARVADEVVCALTPEPFRAVGLWYEDFRQTTDDEVRDLLTDAAIGRAEEQATQTHIHAP